MPRPLSGHHLSVESSLWTSQYVLFSVGPWGGDLCEACDYKLHKVPDWTLQGEWFKVLLQEHMLMEGHTRLLLQAWKSCTSLRWGTGLKLEARCNLFLQGNSPASLLIGYCQSLPSLVHWIISSKPFRGVWFVAWTIWLARSMSQRVGPEIQSREQDRVSKCTQFHMDMLKSVSWKVFIP